MRFWRFVREMVKDTIKDVKKRNKANFERNLVYNPYTPSVLGNRLRIK